ncbi:MULTISPECIES: hypothetical protein [unclassified Coleofasciculus]|uniref:hypothetical protein n=1 Tax=unclassified Coleofasciculus TaxID=2692782 RepID=UPI00187F568A|nr:MULTISPECIES: hypothetical protein [unclassified Coleofasciculus]MBE9128198.1 hypothetical protein [Coleofasciculus sp. LEGE 07081]MBE9150960.1 hypothetical protein [Coleofasciculus sp. LEGE 07092]
MMTTDAQLQELIAKICENLTVKKWEKRRAINRLLLELQHLPGLLKSSHLDYLEALDKTWEWVSRNICRFQLRPRLSIQQSLVRWINGYLVWRIRDLYQQADSVHYSLDRPIDDRDANPTNWLEQLPETNSEIPILSGIDAYIHQLQNQEIQEIYWKLESYIEQDPEGKLRKCHPRKHPDCNCQLLSQKLLLQSPPVRLTDISRELGVNYRTLKSHWENKCKPLLQEIAVSLGYQRE